MANQKLIKVHNKSNLPVIDYKKLTDFQGTLKKIDQSSLDKLKRSIIKYGFSFPAAVWKTNRKIFIIDSHQRYRACEELEAEGYNIPPIPYYEIKAKDREDAKKKLLLINSKYGKINEQGFLDFIFDIDFDDIVEDIDIPEIDLDSIYSELNSDKDDIEDEVPEVEEKEVVIKQGDLIELGKHRLLCGDCTVKENVDKLMNGKKADMCFQSPPYNVGHNIGYKNKKSKYKNNNDNIKDYKEFIYKTTVNAIDNAKEVFINIQLLANNKKDIIKYMNYLVEYFKDIFYWKKLQVQPAIACNVANSQVEIILLFGSNNKSRSWGNKKFRGNFSNYIETKSASGENKNVKIHNATFPVSLPLLFIDHGYKYNSLIMDLFIGTGTMIIAGEKTNRICYGMEIDECYCQVIIERYLNYTDTNKLKINGKEYIWENYKKRLLKRK